MIRRACCASTRFASISPASAMDWRTAFFVISLKRTRRNGTSFEEGFSASWRCHEMASPSRSGSAARNTAVAPRAAFFSSPSVFSFPGTTTYVGS